MQCGKCPQASDAVIATCVTGFYTVNVNFVPFAHWGQMKKILLHTWFDTCTVVGVCSQEENPMKSKNTDQDKFSNCLKTLLNQHKTARRKNRYLPSLLAPSHGILQLEDP